MEERLSDEIVAAVADGTADVGIVAGTVEVAGLEVLPFRVDRFVLVVATNHALSTVERISFAEVLDFDFVGLDRASALQRFLSEKAERIGRRLRLRVQLRSFDAVCRLVECNVGIGVVLATTAERHVQTMSIHHIELLDEWAVRKLTICVRRQADLPICERELVRHLAEPPRPINRLRCGPSISCEIYLRVAAFRPASSKVVGITPFFRVSQKFTGDSMR